jgi:hypothetical protein
VAAGRRAYSLAALDALERHAVGIVLLIGAVVLVASVFLRKPTVRSEATPGWNRSSSIKAVAV